MLARERTGDLRLDHLHIELQWIDLEEGQVRVFSNQPREEEIIDARAVAARVGEIHRRQRFERAGVLFRT